jgi:pimeloyl-ACP methyl ester carboxylesterase
MRDAPTVDVPAPTVLPLRTRDDVSLAGWWWSATATPHAAVVLVHGFGGRGDTPVLREHVAALLADGYDVLTYDARGHGESSGACTLGEAERSDVAAAVAAARERSATVIVVGESAGATATLGYATEDTELTGIVTVGAPAAWTMKPNLRAVAAAILTRTRLGRWLAHRLMHVVIHPRLVLPDPPSVMSAKLQMPLAVVHGEDDPFIPAREARQLHGGANGPAMLDLVAAMGHGFGTDSVGPVRSAVAWVLTQHR